MKQNITKKVMLAVSSANLQIPTLLLKFDPDAVIVFGQL